MTGIIHFDSLSRVEPKVSRRALLGGGTAAALSLALRARAHAQTTATAVDATPEVRGETTMVDARERLRSLLSLIPATIAGPDPTDMLFDWVDYDTQFAALGIADPYAETSSLVPTLMPLATSDRLAPRALEPEIADIVGFRPLDVHQVLVAGVPPLDLTVYRGGFSIDALITHWGSSGYERRTGEYGDYWTSGEDGEMDLTNPLHQIVFSSMNNAVVLDDRTVVFGSTYADIEPVLALRAGDGEALTSNEHLDRLIDSMPQDTVSVMATPGEAYMATTLVPENPGMDTFTTVEELLAESDDAVGPMPPLLLSLSGVTAGIMVPDESEDGSPVPRGNEDAFAFMSFLTESEEDARAAAEVAYWRLENMESMTTGVVYSDRFVPLDPVEEAVDGEVMTVRFGGWAVSGAWRSLILARDTWPFAWLP